MIPQISADFDSVSNAIRRISVERATVPEPGAVRQVEGTSIGVTSPFHTELDTSAQLLSNLVATIRQELDATQDAIRKTIQDMVDKDATLADEAKTILAVLDSTVDVKSSTPASNGPADASPSTVSKDW